MPGLDKALLRTTVSGFLHGSQSFSTKVDFALDGAGGSTQSELNDWNLNLLGGTTSYWRAIAADLFDSDTILRSFVTRYYPIGSTVATLVSIEEFSTFPSTAAATLPPLCALVASIKSDTPGRSGRGRMYFPATGLIVNAAGQAGDGDCTNLASNVASIYSHLNGTAYPSGAVVHGVVASFTKGQTYPVTSISVDSLIDTQHRRQDKLSATFTAIGPV